MSFGLKFISIVSIAGVLAWAASAAPLKPSGKAQSEGAGYGYGGTKVTLCHIPPGKPGNAHTITVGAPAVPAHLAHGDTLGPCSGNGKGDGKGNGGGNGNGKGNGGGNDNGNGKAKGKDK